MDTTTTARIDRVKPDQQAFDLATTAARLSRHARSIGAADYRERYEAEVRTLADAALFSAIEFHTAPTPTPVN